MLIMNMYIEYQHGLKLLHKMKIQNHMMVYSIIQKDMNLNHKDQINLDV